MKDKLFEELMNEAMKSECTCQICLLLKEWIRKSIIEYGKLQNDR